MKVFKVILLVILGILLSLSLLIFGLALTLNQSVLNPDFIAEHVERLDIAALADEIVREQVPPEAAEFMGESLDEVLGDTIADIELWMKEQARDGIYVFYDYIEGRSESLSLIISLETVKESFRANLLAAILASPPPELVGFPPAEIELQFNEYWSQIDEEIPSALELDETMLDAEVMEQITHARQYVGYFNLAFIVLIAFSLLLILLIILTHFSVRGSTRQLGITFLSIGVVSLAGALITRSVASSQLVQNELPSTLQAWAPEVITDVLMPLGLYGIGLIVVGIALTVISFVCKRDQHSYY
ncbi:MAG: hypothetical protein A2Z76_01430 [Chloroflexi bacterium RBG_13_56_8b]|nr:MAG: hypothetical protein A2Z76_01430 [Chloroflexi bacterium RBG_13_56_8b]